MKRQREKIYVSNPLANATGRQYSGNYMQGGKVIGTQKQLPTYPAFEANTQWEKTFGTVNGTKDMIMQLFMKKYAGQLAKELGSLPKDAINYLSPYDLSNPEVRMTVSQAYKSYFKNYPYDYLREKASIAAAKVDNQESPAWNNVMGNKYPELWKKIANFYIPEKGSFDILTEQILKDIISYKGGDYFYGEQEEASKNALLEGQEKADKIKQNDDDDAPPEDNKKGSSNSTLVIVGIAILAAIFIFKKKAR